MMAVLRRGGAIHPAKQGLLCFPQATKLHSQRVWGEAATSAVCHPPRGAQTSLAAVAVRTARAQATCRDVPQARELFLPFLVNPSK